VELEVLLAALGFVLTVLIFSYLLGDNPLYRLSLHIFVGASTAFVCVVALQSVILPVMLPPDTSDPDIRLFWFISLFGALLGALLFVRGIRGLSWLSDVSVAVLLGVGVGVALGGAVLGTLVPQVDAATNSVIPEPPIEPDVLKPVGQVIALVGTVTGLLAFSFTLRRPARRFVGRWLNRGSRVGQWFLLIGFGAVYGGVVTASLAFFADRVQYLIDVLEKVSGG
jgi:hypothetical protein